jgi:hypothetical protein
VKRIRNLAVGVWEFIAGDDWITAVGVVAALGVTALLADHDAAWVTMPLSVAALLAVSIWRAARANR